MEKIKESIKNRLRNVTYKGMKLWYISDFNLDIINVKNYGGGNCKCC